MEGDAVVALDEPMRLECGVEVGELAAQVADRLPPTNAEHQATCPHCQAALAQLNALWGDVRELARREVSMPERVVQEVLARAREERPGSEQLPLRELVPRLLNHALLEGPRGSTRIAESVITEIARRAALAEPGVAGLQPERPGDTGLSLAVDRHHVRLVVRLRVRFGYSAPEVAANVRTRVIDAVETLTGLHAERVDVVVADLSADG